MASSSNAEPLAIRFQQPDLRRLLVRLVQRLRRGRSLSGSLRISNPTEAERRAIAALLGSSSGSGQNLCVDLDVLAMIATRNGRFASLQQLVEAAHGGPIENDFAHRAAHRDAWARLWSTALDRCGASGPLHQWVSDPKTHRWIRWRTAGDVVIAQQLLAEVFTVLDRLPIEPPMSLAQLAAELFGDSHALDATTDLGRLAARGAAALTGRQRPCTTAEVRAAWSNVGVVPDELSATVLVLNIPALPGTPLGEMLSLHSRLGEPCRITFRQLRRIRECRFDRSQDAVISVCENPSVLAAAADHLGARCRPLVCVEGQPNLAADTLLRTLHQHGFAFRYHGDFDWGGLRIAARLWHRFHFISWRYSAQDYRTAPHGRTLNGVPAEAPWDPNLKVAMQACQKAVHEEAVLKTLLADLASEPEHNLHATTESKIATDSINRPDM
jgi:uncharacterized protein (TIGR02679 family)